MFSAFLLGFLPCKCFASVCWVLLLGTAFFRLSTVGFIWLLLGSFAKTIARPFVGTDVSCVLAFCSCAMVCSVWVAVLGLLLLSLLLLLGLL